MKGLYKNAFRKLVAAGMAVGMVLGCAGMAGAESAPSKEETVYIFTDASGNQTKVLVSDWLKNSDNESEIKDATTLKDVTNVKGDETYSQGSGDEIIWNSDGNDIYYQGTTDKETPISVKITYTVTIILTMRRLPQKWEMKKRRSMYRSQYCPVCCSLITAYLTWR